jgi:hypothetical protein
VAGKEKRGIKLSRRTFLLTALAIVGVFLLMVSVNVGFTIGSEWFGANASEPWHMNNYFVIPAQSAFIYFGLATMAIGGLATGIAAPAFFSLNKSAKNRIVAVGAFFSAIIMTGLGFNTLDFMSGNFYWTNMQYPSPIHVPVVGSVDVWNYYFFFFVVPLWLGGFIVGIAASYYSFISHPKRLTVGYATKKYPELPGLSLQGSINAEGYMAETRAVSRSRQPQFSKENFASNYKISNGKILFYMQSKMARSTVKSN